MKETLYKLIVADDEETVREGLSTMIDWKTLGFELVALFEDGQEVMDYLAETDADVILTDIKMTFSSGLDVAKYVFENRPHIVMVILSGYKEFEYAQKAINYNVAHYLLKPTNINEIEAIFKKIKTELDSRRVKEETQKEMTGIYEEMRHILREQLFSELLSGSLCGRHQEIERRTKLAGLGEYGYCCAIAKINLIDYRLFLENIWKYGRDELYNCVFNSFNGEADGILYQPVYSPGDCVDMIIMSKDCITPEILKEKATEYLTAAGGRMDKLFGLKSQTEIYGVFESLFDLADRRPIVSLDEDGGAQLTQAALKHMLSYISEGETEAAETILSDCINAAESGEGKSKAVRDFFRTLLEALDKMGVELPQRIKTDTDALLSMTLAPEELLKNARMSLNSITEFLREERESYHTGIINRAKDYIKRNYSNDISLEDVAANVYLSPMYFSRLFKQLTGENYSDYLIRVRMQRALELMKDPSRKTVDVCRDVGYKNTKYFTRLFRKFTGIKVTDYRQGKSY